jgi:hypothetical protein
MDDTFPLDCGLLEIDEKTNGPAGGSQRVEKLRGVLAAEPFHTFQLDHQHIFDEQIGKVISDRVTLIVTENEASAVAWMPRRASSLSSAL